MRYLVGAEERREGRGDSRGEIMGEEKEMREEEEEESEIREERGIKEQKSEMRGYKRRIGVDDKGRCGAIGHNSTYVCNIIRVCLLQQSV